MAAWNIKLEHWARQRFGEPPVDRVLNGIRVQKLRRAEVLFVHIPKAAGSSIAHAVNGRRAGHLTAAEMCHYLGQDYFDQRYSFAVLREPSERLLSAYYYARSQGGTHGGMLPHPDYQSAAFASPDTFVSQWLSQSPLQGKDRIFWPQSAFIQQSDQLLVKALFRLDQLGFLEQVLSEKLQRPIAFGRLNQNKSTKKTGFSANSIAQLQQLYAQDYQLYHSLETSAA